MMTMNDPRPLETPRPAAEEIRRSLASELSTRSRVLYTLLLLVDLTLAAAVGSLWLTEPSLPARTQIAFGLLLVFALTWSGFLLWTLTRRKVLLTGHRVLAGRLAVLFCSLFTVGALALGLSQPDRRATGLSAAGMGGFLLLVAIVLLIRSQRRYRELTARRRHLERELKGGSGSSGAALVFAALLLLPLGKPAAGQPLTPRSLGGRGSHLTPTAGRSPAIPPAIPVGTVTANRCARQPRGGWRGRSTACLTTCPWRRRQPTPSTPPTPAATRSWWRLQSQRQNPLASPLRCENKLIEPQ